MTVVETGKVPTIADAEKLVTSAYQLLDGGDLAPEQAQELWDARSLLPSITGSSLEDLAGNRFETLFRAYEKQLQREDALAGLLKHSTDPQSFSADTRRQLLANIEDLKNDEIFTALLKPHYALLEDLRTSVSNDAKIAAHGSEAVCEGWVTLDQLQRGKVYVVNGTRPFVVQDVSKDGQHVRVSVENDDGYTAHLFKPDTLAAPERTAAWQAVGVSSLQRQGITPEGAALWFAAGEMYRLTTSTTPDEAQRWNKLLSPYTNQRTGEPARAFAERIIFRAYSGPIGQPGALEHKDIEDLRSLILEVAQDTGIDLVRLGVAGQRARFTASMGWEQLSTFDKNQPKMFGEASSVRTISRHGDAVLRSALWNHGVHILEHRDLRHFQDVQRAGHVPTATLERYVPKAERKDSDSFSKALDLLKSKPSLELARKIVEPHADTIRNFLENHSVAVDSSLVLVAAPSSSQAARFLTLAIAEMFTKDGVTTRDIFSKRVLTSRHGKNSETDAVVGSTKSSHNFYDRAARAYSSTEIAGNAGLKSGQNVLIIDDITTMGCTRDVCAMMMGHFKPEKVLFLAVGKTK